MFDIPNGEKVPTDLTRMFQQIRSYRRKIDRRESISLRASSFPICPRAYHIFRRTPIAKRPAYEEAFVLDSTSLMGTALHLVLQRWFGLQGFLYGNWVCVHCKKIVKHHTGTPTCEGCGRPMIYEEYSIKRTKDTPFSGHVDGIFRLPNSTYLIDFKSSSLRAIRELRSSGKPKDTHYLQVNAYANAINMQPEVYGGVERIEKIIIIYVDRGEPHRTWHPVQVPVSQHIYKETISRIYLARQSLLEMRIPRGLCLMPSDPFGKYCSWKQICFSPAIEGLLSDKIQPASSPTSSTSDSDLLLLASYLS